MDSTTPASTGYSLQNDFTKKVPGLTLDIWANYRGPAKLFRARPLRIVELNGWTVIAETSDRFVKRLCQRPDGKLVRLGEVDGGGSQARVLGTLENGRFVLDPRSRPPTEDEITAANIASGERAMQANLAGCR